MKALGIFWGAWSRIVWMPLVLLIAVVTVYRSIRVDTAIKSLGAAQNPMITIHGYSRIKMILKALLSLIGSLFLFIALLEPQWNKKEQTVEQEGRDLFIALDISRSMLVADCAPDRLACAKKKIKTLLSHLPCERVGLILFSGSTMVQCPLTTDYGAFLMFLDHIDVETISSGTTALDAAIRQALAAFNVTPDRKNRLLAIFTDGEDFSRDLNTVKNEAQRAGMFIFTVGVGTSDGGPIPLFDIHGAMNGHQRAEDGTVVISQLNEVLLKEIAHESGGTYIKISPNDSDMRALCTHVERFEKERLADKKVAMFDQQYPYFVAVSFMCFILEWLL